MRRLLSLLFAAAVGATAIGCSDGGSGDGAVAIRLSGEDAAKVGYPLVKNGVDIRFIDGWSVRFTKYLVSVGQIRLAAADGAEAFASSDVFVADLHRGDPVIVTYGNLAARRYERLSFRVVAAPEDARPVGEVAPEDLARMKREGLNYLIAGRAEKNGRTVTFDWGLKNPSRATNCTNGVDGTEGVVVRNGTTSIAELTFHLDHLFWDTLGSEVAELRFDAVDAMSGDDAVVGFDELRSQLLADLRAQGGGPLRDEKGERLFYNPGSVPLPEPTLQAFMLATSASQVHLNGLGLCTITRL